MGSAGLVGRPAPVGCSSVGLNLLGIVFLWAFGPAALVGCLLVLLSTSLLQIDLHVVFVVAPLCFLRGDPWSVLWLVSDFHLVASIPPVPLPPRVDLTVDQSKSSCHSMFHRYLTRLAAARPGGAAEFRLFLTAIANLKTLGFADLEIHFESNNVSRRIAARFSAGRRWP